VKAPRVIATIVAVSYLAGILAAVEAIMTARTSQGAIAWSVSLVSFPFVAVPAYLVLGRSNFAGMTAAYAQRKQEVDALVAQVRENLRPWGIDVTEQSTYRAVHRLSGMELTKGNRVDLLVDGRRPSTASSPASRRRSSTPSSSSTCFTTTASAVACSRR